MDRYRFFFYIKVSDTTLSIRILFHGQLQACSKTLNTNAIQNVTWKYLYTHYINVYDKKNYFKVSLPGLTEFSFLHSLTHIPVHERPLGVHKIELVIQSREHLSHGGRVGQHAHGPLNLGQVTTRYNRGGLIVDAALEASGGPVHELDGSLSLDGGDRGVDVLGHYISCKDITNYKMYSIGCRIKKILKSSQDDV